jgi:hypothetical protein
LHRYVAAEDYFTEHDEDLEHDSHYDPKNDAKYDRMEHGGELYRLKSS